MLVGPRVNLLLQRGTYVKDNMGGSVVTWKDLALLGGVFSNLSGVEIDAYSKASVKAKYKFEIDYNFSVIPQEADQLVLITTSVPTGQRIFQITWIKNPGMLNRNLTLVLDELKQPGGETS